MQAYYLRAYSMNYVSGEFSDSPNKFNRQVEYKRYTW